MYACPDLLVDFQEIVVAGIGQDDVLRAAEVRQQALGLLHGCLGIDLAAEHQHRYIGVRRLAKSIAEIRHLPGVTRFRQRWMKRMPEQAM